MNKTTLSIFFALAFAFSGCTVHHYHHHTSVKRGKKARHHKGKKGGAHHGLPPGHPAVGGMHGHDLPEGHPRVKGMCGHKTGHKMRGHKMHGERKMPKGHGMQGQRKMPNGHGKGGHDMHGERELPQGHPPLNPHKGHHGPSSKGDGDSVHNPFEKHSEAKGGHDHGDAEHGKHALPTAIDAFYSSFTSAWHSENDAERRTAACAKVAEWKSLGLAVKKLKGGVVFTAATKDLQKQVASVGTSCARKKGDVQAALTNTHDALHMLFRVLPKPSPGAEAKPTAASQLK